MSVLIDDVHVAAAVIAGKIKATPTLALQTLSQISGATLYLKTENLQYTGSFKDRGAATRLDRLGSNERRAGVIAM